MLVPRSSQRCCCVYFLLTFFRPVLSANRLLATAFFLVSTLCFPISNYGQSSSATLGGTVEDQAGAVVTGANIALIYTSQGTQRLSTTNSEGAFIFVQLPPGKYSVTATATGFAPVEIKDVVLNVNDQKRLRIQLSVGTVSQSVEIREGAVLINESPAVATVVDRQFVENILLNGRSLQSLIALTPGTVPTKANSSERGQFSTNGQRADANYFTVDGVSANIGVSPGSTLGQGGGGALPALTATGGTNNLVSIDALQEFKIQTSSYAPEFGRTPGAQVQLITRSGTNGFHGSLFEYFRNDVLDASDWFNNALRQKKPAMRQNDFGGVIGGPILLPRFGEGGGQPGYNGRNKTFFFASYEGLRLRQPLTQITDVPSISARQSAPVSVQPFLNAYPLPNGPNQLGTNGLPNGFAEFAASYSDPSSLNASSIRIDHTFSEKLAIFGRYNHAPSDIVQRGDGFTLNTVTTTRSDTDTLTGGAIWNISPTIINDLRLNWSRNTGSQTLHSDSFGGAVPLSDSILFRIPPRTSQDSLYSFSIGGGRQTTLRVGSQADHEQRQINLVDNLTLIAGKHQLRFGSDYRRLYPIFQPRLYAQTFNFSGFGLTGTPPVGSVFSTRLASGSVIGLSDTLFPVFTNFSAYAQDTWKVTTNLVLTYGLRWDVNPAPSERNNNDPAAVTQAANLATLDIAPRGTPLYQTRYGNVAPRVGVSYQLSPRQGRETVLRSGFGIFYDLGTGVASDAFSTFPFTANRPLTGNPFFPLSPTLLVPPTPDFNARPINQLNASDPNLKLPRTYQWNAAIEQSLGASQTVTASYVGARGRDLLRQEQIFNPNPRFLFLTVTRSIAESDYNALQLQFQRRLRRGLQALASYTWSKSTDTVSGDSFRITPAEKLDPQLDRGPSNFDVRHIFASAITYNIPSPSLNTVANSLLHDWAIDATFNVRSATPVSVGFSRDIGFGSFSARPDLVPGVPLYLDDPTAPGGKRFNNTPVPGNPRQVGPFFIPTEGRQGNLGRNALRGFGFHQLDLALRRQFNITERLKLQFRSEFFNIFNHPNFADPNSSLGSVTSTGVFSANAGFGRSTSMLGKSLGAGGSGGGLNPLYQIGGARSIQFSVKLQF